MEEINALIEANHIREITFVLSDSNSIIKDALTDQVFNSIKRLRGFYDELVADKKCTRRIWQAVDVQLPLISSYLNYKAEQLQLLLNDWLIDQVTVNAKIYFQSKRCFNEIDLHLLSMKHLSLN